MPLLANLRHEAFAQAIARGATVDAAYTEAGYSPNRGNAGRLNANEGVKTRIGELRELRQNIEKRSTVGVALTKAWVTEQLIGVVLDARSQEKPDSAGANKALHLLGLELGMFVERKEEGKPGEFDGLTIATKRERITNIAKQLGLERLSAEQRLAFQGPVIDVPSSPGDEPHD